MFKMMMLKKQLPKLVMRKPDSRTVKVKVPKDCVENLTFHTKTSLAGRSAASFRSPFWEQSNHLVISMGTKIKFL